MEPISIPITNNNYFNDLNSDKASEIYKSIELATKDNFPQICTKVETPRFRDVQYVDSTIIPKLGTRKCIAANHVSMKEIPDHQFIASQAPTPGEFYTFWDTAGRSNYSILDLTNPKDDNDIDCYTPINSFGTSVIDHQNCPSLNIKRTKSNFIGKEEGPLNIAFLREEDYDVSVDGSTNQVKRFHYNKWPDKGVISLEELTDMVNILRKEASNNILIHCKAGVGRTGTIITAYLVQILIEQKIFTKENYDKGIHDLVVNLRRQRSPMFIQTEEQFKLVYDFGIKCLNQEIQTTARYEKSPHQLKVAAKSLTTATPTNFMISPYPSATYDYVEAFRKSGSTIVNLTTKEETDLAGNRKEAYLPGKDESVSKMSDDKKNKILIKNINDVSQENVPASLNQSVKINKYALEKCEMITVEPSPGSANLGSTLASTMRRGRGAQLPKTQVVVEGSIQNSEIKEINLQIKNFSNTCKISIDELFDLVILIEQEGGKNIFVHGHNQNDAGSSLIISACILKQKIEQNEINSTNLDEKLVNIILDLKRQINFSFDESNLKLLREFGVKCLKA